MLKLLTRGLRARATRYLLSAASIAVGVALVSGTAILAQSARTSYAELVGQVSFGTDLYVRGPETDVRRGISDFAPVPDAMLQRVRAVPGVAQAQGQVLRVAQLVTAAGKFLDPDRPTYMYSWPESTELSPFVLTAGRAPSVTGEVAVSNSTARAERLHIGDAIRLSVDVGSPRPERIAGFVQPRTGGDLTGAAAVFIDASSAQHFTGIGDQWDLIEVAARPDVAVEALRDQIAAVMPDDGTAVITSAEYNNAQLANLVRRSSSLTAILLALSLLAFVVGCGVVFNTFSILLAQRTSELSLLRTVGMARSQVYLSVVGEGVVVGLVASTAGALAGVPAAYALRGLASLSGQDADIGRIHFDLAIVGAAAMLGTLACVAISTVPARRASRVAPVAAWRDAQPATPSPVPARFAILPASLGIVGLILLLLGVVADPARAGLVAGGAITTTVAVLLALPVCAPRLFRFLGALAGRTGAAGTVAGTSASGNPRRVAMPMLAVVLGLGMVTSVAVLATSAHAAMHQLVSRADRADFVVVSDAAPGIDVEAVEKLAEAPAVRVVSEMGDDTFHRDARSEQFTALDSDTAPLVLNLPVLSGTLAHFADGSIAVTRDAARRWGYHVGDFVPAKFGLPQRRFLRVDAIIADNGITHDWVIPFETYRKGYRSAPIRAVFVKGAATGDLTTLRRQVDVGVNGFPGVSVLDARTYARAQAVKAEGPIALVQALVGLSIVIALLGVANALGLSVVERRWELGLLDVLGMTPAQVSLTVQCEAVFIALAGVVFGVGAGLVLGLGLAQAVTVHGFTRLAVPFQTIAGVSVLVVVAAFLAATIPARHAVRLSEIATVNRLT